MQISPAPGARAIDVLSSTDLGEVNQTETAERPPVNVDIFFSF